MKESRIIAIVSLILMIIIPPVFWGVSRFGLSRGDCFNIAANLYCGVIVGLITAISQYFISKRRIVNTVYSLYFELYKTYYYSINKRFLGHYNISGIYKKMIEVIPKISEALDEYHGIFIAKDRMYRKMNPVINVGDEYKGKNIIKTLFWFNKKSYERTIGSYIKEVENILSDIDNKKLNRDKKMLEKNI